MSELKLKFQIGDEVETTEEYKRDTEEYNKLRGEEVFEPYIRGIVTSFKINVKYNFIQITVGDGCTLAQDCFQKVKK